MTAEKETECVDPKLPSWNGDWTSYSDYQLRVELRADSTKKEELPLLGPRLAANLTGRAFDTLVEVNREELKKEQGWRYLLTSLQSKRGKEKIDLLGDLFTEFFAKRESHRREGEDLSGYEPRFRQLVRRLDKAVAESGAEGKIPTELYGWVLLNMYMKLDASDTANVRGRADSYKLEDIFASLKKMWSGGGLCAKDLERKRKKEGLHFVQERDHEGEVHAASVDECDPQDETAESFSTSELEEATAWYQETLEALLEEPEDGTILANFKEARKALDQARTARGFYPVRNPNQRSYYPSGGKGHGKKGNFSGKNGSSSSFADKYCLRCGKKGHIARICPQKPSGGRDSTSSSHDKVGYIGWNEAGMREEYHEAETSGIWQVGEVSMAINAILDSGASDNIVGIETLQDWAEQIDLLGFSSSEEIFIDRQQRKKFTFGNSACAAALGKAYVTVGMFDQQVELTLHVVEGTTPFLLSARFLEESNASINFRTGRAVFRRYSENFYHLERTPGGHLILPLLGFAGNDCAYKALLCSEPDPDVQAVSSEEPPCETPCPSAEKGKPEDEH